MQWDVKAPHLHYYHETACSLLDQVCPEHLTTPLAVQLVLRELNTAADRMANEAMDQAQGRR